MRYDMKTCCFFGHRKVDSAPALKTKLSLLIEDLITNRGFDTFLFGSRSEFNSLCYEVVSELKEKHPHIKRIYVRGEYPDIDDDYKKLLLKHYEETCFPEKVRGAGRLSYVVRNREMILKSELCVIYYNEEYLPSSRKSSFPPQSTVPKSGTRLAYEYARQKKKEIINIFK